MKRISATSSLLQLYKMKLATAGEMALMVTDRIKSKQILHSLIIDAIEKCRIEYNYLNLTLAYSLVQRPGFRVLMKTFTSSDRKGGCPLLLTEIFQKPTYQEKRPEFENNGNCSLLLFLTVSCLVRAKMINVKQQLSRAGNFNISGNFFPITFEFSARPK